MLAVNLAKDTAVGDGNILTSTKTGEALKVQPASVVLSPLDSGDPFSRRLQDTTDDEETVDFGTQF